jgi:hypothetical protein
MHFKLLFKLSQCGIAKKEKEGIMIQPPLSQELLSEQFSVLLLTLEKTAQSYFISGQLEKALQLLRIGMQLLSMPEATPREQVRLRLSYGNMLAIKTNFANASVSWVPRASARKFFPGAAVFY